MLVNAVRTRAGLATLVAVTLQLAILCTPVTGAQSTPRDCLAANGLAYGPFRDGQGPEYRLPINPRVEQIEEDLTFLGQITKRIRTYSTTSTQADIPRLAKRFGISVAQGIYLGPDEGTNEKQIAAALQMARDGLVESLIVGNEVLTASTLPKAKLLEYVRRVKKLAPRNVPVATAELWDKWNSNPDIAEAVDFVVAHFYAFWEGQSISDATESLWRNYDTLQKTLRAAYPSRTLRIVIGETGWPSGGAQHGLAVPGAKSQRRFIEEFMTSACERSVPYYFFEAFDEEWKWREGASSIAPGAQPLSRDRSFVGNRVGSSWGIYRSNGKLKPELIGLFDQPSSGSRLEREIFVDGQLSAYYDIGVDTSHKQRAWLATSNGALEMAYPAGQEWGAVFITVGKPTNPPRPWKDFSDFDSVAFELRGGQGGEAVEVGIKDFADPNSGRETKVPLTNVGTQFRTYTFRLSQFASRQLSIPAGLARLNVVLEFVFTGPRAQTVYARNIRYVASR